MEAHLIEFLGLLVRWLHVIAGIAWIGSSFYFIWLDNSLEAPPPDSDAAKKGVAGELWAVHGGGFYNPQKYAVAPPTLPALLHWFKWEAYTTWLSGFALLGLVYWMRAQAMMIDQNVRLLTTGQAVGIGAASMVGSWIFYDLLCRSPLGKREGLLGAFVFAFITLFSLPAWRAEGRLASGLATAFVVAVASSAAIAWLFESVFLVRLP